MTPGERADPQALPDGLKINEYEIERTLGVGGFGITYLARDCNLDLPVAIKEYFPTDLVTRDGWNAVHMRTHGREARQQFDGGLARFLDEARALATFRHPNIIRVLRYFLDNGTGYIVMEYESGQSLKRWVPHHAPLSQQATLSIVQPLLDGLEMVHRAGFLHRDIKPDNIYVREDNSPVLLDFGSARRVRADRDMTNIISPGFAPFEQYHSHGNQGPWTDIYSLGAVMYWIVTGRKPMESAARVKKDDMLPATQLADVAVFGRPLLEAIDWAMTPEEEKRPQSVAQFRTAMQGAPVIDLPTDPGAPPPDRAGIAFAGHAASQPPSDNLSGKRNVLGTILCIELIEDAKRKMDDQAAIKKLFNQLVAKALRGVAPEGVITLDTGGGAAVCFTGDPEEALDSALLLRDLLEQRYRSLIVVRTGIHMGPVRVVADLNQHVNVIGDGISVAQRVMEFAQAGQVLVSRSYYDVISRITDDTADMFMYLGQLEDRHGRLHEVYSVGAGERTTRREQQPEVGSPAQGASLADEAVHEVEVELARHIGPLAKVLVAKARPLAGSMQALREAVAHTIQDERLRTLFLEGHKGHTHPADSRSSPLSGARATSRSGGPSTASAAASASPPSGTRAVDVLVEELAAMEHTLSRFIGPMARIVVKKEAGKSGTFKDLVASLAASVDDTAERERFIADLHKALPRRPF